MTLRAGVAVALIVLAGPTMLAVQGRGGLPLPDEAPQRPEQPAVFRGGVTLVQIDAYVTDARGNPVTGLTAEDFEVLEGGQPRAVSTFAATNIPIAADLPAGNVEADVATNTTPEGRRYLIALDEVSPDRVLRARNLVRRFVAEHLGPNDVAAVALTGRGLASSGQDFTGNHSLLLKALDKFTGGFESATPNVEQTDSGVQGPGQDRAFSSDPRQLASSLRRLTEFLATLPGRKTLLYVGEGLGGLDFFDVVDYNGGALTPAAIDAHAAVVAATRGNVTIYPIDARGLTTDLTPPGEPSAILETRADLAALADVTGGFSFTGSNNLAPAFERVVAESSTYYTIGFNSEHARLDGRFVSVEVRVKRPGLQVRSRNGYVAPLGPERKPERVQSDTRLRAVADALATPVATRGIPLRVFAAPFKGARKKAAVALAIEIDASAVGGQDGNGVRTVDLEISYFATSSRGSVTPGRRHTATISRPSTTAAQAWVRVLSEIELEAGRYQLRVAAGTAFNAGSVVYDLEIPDFSKGPLVLSGISMTSAAAAAVPTQRPQDPLGGTLPAAPTAAREFSGDDRLVLFAEVYDNRGTSRSEPPRTIELTASLLNEAGHVIRLAAAEPRPSSAQRRGPGTRGFTMSLPLDVPPGAYIIAVNARAGRDTPARRSIPIRVR